MGAPSPSESAYPWYRLVQMCGDEGTRWMRDYVRVNPHTDRIMAAVPVLRRGDLCGGESMLAEAWEGLSAVPWDDPSVQAVAERWYYGALGYAHYCRGDYDEADRVMARACDAMAQALGQKRFLLVIADEVVELVLHRARIARNRHRWDEMREHVEAARGMRDGTRPYYALEDGRSVWLHDVQAFLDELPLPDDARPVRPHLQREAERRQDTERCVRDVLRLPGMIIHYP
jgi:hypothetical protein